MWILPPLLPHTRVRAGGYLPSPHGAVCCCATAAISGFRCRERPRDHSSAAFMRSSPWLHGVAVTLFTDTFFQEPSSNSCTCSCLSQHRYMFIVPVPRGLAHNKPTSVWLVNGWRHISVSTWEPPPVVLFILDRHCCRVPRAQAIITKSL